MSKRESLLWLIILALVLYAWRDWFVSLCGLIVLMAVMERPDMPRAMFEIQGLNPWNVLMVSVVLAWVVQRRQEGLTWDMPRPINIMLGLYLAVIVVGFVRMIADRPYAATVGHVTLISDALINTVKWVVPGMLLFDGCRSRRRLTLALGCLGVMYILLTLQVIVRMPPSVAVSGEALSAKRHVIQKAIGYNAVSMSAMLSGASWAILAMMVFFRRWRYRLAVVAGFLLVTYGQALTGGRMGYVTWGLVGVMLCAVRWRRHVILLPVVPVVIGLAVPGAVDRMLQGFGKTDPSGQTYADEYQVSSGRLAVWPFVVDQILEAPMFGYGREAMIRTGLDRKVYAEADAEGFPHPHNAYLEWLLDNGIVGFVLVMPFYAVVVVYAGRLFRDRSGPWYAATGGAALSLVLALLIASMGGQHFYPRQANIGMWAAIFLMLRLWVQRARIRAWTGPGRPRVM